MNGRSDEEYPVIESFLDDSFQSRDHFNLIYLMSLMGFEINPSGMCHGFALTALHYNSQGKLSEYDFLIHHLLGMYHDSFKFGGQKDEILAEKLKSLNAQLKNQPDRISLEELFSKAAAFQQDQEKDSAMTFSETIDGIYDEDDINHYLGSISDIYINEYENNPSLSLSLILQSSQHTLLIILKDDKVLIRDINYPHKYFLEGIEQIYALALNQSEEKSLLISSKFYIPNDENKENVKICIEKWKDTDEFKSIHELNLERMRRISKDGNSLLSQAALNNDIELVKQICTTFEADINSEIFARALFVALFEKHEEMTDIFLSHPSCSVNIPAASIPHGYSLFPLCASILYGSDELSKRIIELGADPNSDNKLRLNILADYDNLLKLFEKSIEININKEIDHLTPLHFAALLGSENMVEILFFNGAKAAMCSGGFCADDFAKCMGHDALAEKILKQCQSDCINEIKLLEIDLNSGDMDHVNNLINNQHSAKDCLTIKKFFESFFDLTKIIHSQSTLNELFANKYDLIYESIFSQKNNLDDLSKIKASMDELSFTINIIKNIHVSEFEKNSEFYGLQNEALLRLKNTIAKAEVNWISGDLCNKVFHELKTAAELIHKTESSKFLSYTVHEDWKNALRDCYNKIGLVEKPGYQQMINKAASIVKYHSLRINQGFKVPINDVKQVDIKQTLNEQIQITNALTLQKKI